MAGVARGATAAARTRAAPALPGYLAMAAFAALYLGVWIEWPFPV
ncbi:hypothetical protein [Conyzicola nivalis]